MIIKTLKQILTVMLIVTVIFAKENAKKESTPSKSFKTMYDSKYGVLNINNLTTWHAYDGKANHSPGADNGMYYPKGTGNVIYQDGVIWGGKAFIDAGKTTAAPGASAVRVGGGSYGVGTTGGHVTGSGASAAKVSTGAKVWRIRRDYNSMTDDELRKDAANVYEIGTADVTDGQIAVVKSTYAGDWTTWPVDLGAPFIDRNNNGVYNPPPAFSSSFTQDNLISGNYDEPGVAGADPNSPADQVLFMIYNDLDVTQALGFVGSEPLGIEVAKTVWGYKRNDALGNLYFAKYRLINKGGVTLDAQGNKGSFYIDSLYVCQWSDPDLGSFSDDLAGCDTTLSLSFIYNANGIDDTFKKFGLAPASAGYDFLQGPKIASVGDSAVFNLKRIKDFKNLGMSSFSYFSAGSPYSDPPGGASAYSTGTGRWWNMLRGFAPLGTITDAPQNYKSGPFPVSKFPLSGDPVKGTGFLDGMGTDYSFAPGDRRILSTTGPFNLNPGDTQEIVIGTVAGIGSDRLSSVAVMKFNDKFVQNTYNALFQVPKAPLSPDVKYAELDGEVILEWGSNLTKLAAIEKTIGSPGNYEFEGYNLYQLPKKNSLLSEGKRIATWDVTADPTIVLDESFDQKTGQLLSLPVQFGSNSGIVRTIKLSRDYVRDIDKLYNGQEYYFAVSAYSVAKQVGYLPAALESEPTVITAKPKVSFYSVNTTSYNDTLSVTKVSVSDGKAYPIVINPSAGTGDTYEVSFDTTGGTKKWNLKNKTKNTSILTGKTNETGDANYDMVEGGILLKITGPEPGLKRDDIYSSEDPATWGWNWASGSRFLTWAGGADGFHFESFQGAVGYANPANVFNGIAMGVTPDKIKKVEIRFANVTIDAATGNFTFDKNQPNVSYGYNYIRGGAGAAAKPEFAPFLKRPWNGSYGFNDYSQNVPLAVYDIDAVPERRLAVGFLENNVAGGRVNGTYDPHNYANADNYASSGPREWLFISDHDYTGATLDPRDTISALTNPDYMYFASWARRNNNNWTDVNKLQLTPNRVNTVATKFTYTVPKANEGLQIQLAGVDRIGVYPNPYYAYNPAETNRFARFVTFNNLPKKATFRIFNIAGHLVKLLEKDTDSQFFKWDLNNQDNFPVASGMYLVHIDLPEQGTTKVLKVGIVQEQEILDSY